MPSTSLLMQECTNTKYAYLNNYTWSASPSTSLTTVSLPSSGSAMTSVYYEDLYIPSTMTLTTSSRCKGLFIGVKNDCIIDGTISMSAKGANGIAGVNYSLNKFSLEQNLNNTIQWLTASSGTGGARAGVMVTGYTGGTGKNGGCGGGGSGGGDNEGGYGYSGAGGSGCVYSGGTGGGTNLNTPGVTSAAANGGAPGFNGNSLYGGYPGGGLIILVVRGNLTIGSTGKIISNGTSQTVQTSGGGAGGGSITLVYGGAYSNTGIIQANGGAGHSGGGLTRGSGAGGAGSIRVYKSIF